MTSPMHDVDTKEAHANIFEISGIFSNLLHNIIFFFFRAPLYHNMIKDGESIILLYFEYLRILEGERA
jgi:hypothetical protein